MPQSDVTTLRILRNYLVRNSGKVRARRFTPQRTDVCRRLDEATLGFRGTRMAVAEAAPGGWLRAVRQATGIPVYVLARRLGVTKHEIFRMEKAEKSSRIILANLKRMAEALGCELVYALAPREGSLMDLAAAERETREAARKMARAQERKRVDEIANWMDSKGARGR